MFFLSTLISLISSARLQTTPGLALAVSNQRHRSADLLLVLQKHSGGEGLRPVTPPIWLKGGGRRKKKLL